MKRNLLLAVVICIFSLLLVFGLGEALAYLERFRIELGVARAQLKDQQAEIKSLTSQLEINQAASEEISKLSSVIPIYFYPSDAIPNLLYLPAINRSMAEIQLWYYQQLGKIFKWDPVVIQKGNHELARYQKDDGRLDRKDWGMVFEDLGSLNYPLWEKGKILAIFMQGAGGFAGAASDVKAGWGIALVGDFALEGIVRMQNTCQEPWCTEKPQQGAIAHELAIAFGLPEICPDETTILCKWENFPKVGFTESETQTLLSSPFFHDFFMISKYP